MSVAKKLAPVPSTLLAQQLLGRNDGKVTRLIVVRHPFNRFSCSCQNRRKLMNVSVKRKEFLFQISFCFPRQTGALPFCEERTMRSEKRFLLQQVDQCPYSKLRTLVRHMKDFSKGKVKVIIRNISFRYGKLIVKNHRTSYLHRFNQTSLDKE